jgi:site-specific recombinase XerD
LTFEISRVIIYLFFLEKFRKEAEMALDRLSFESLDFSEEISPSDSCNHLEELCLSEPFGSKIASQCYSGFIYHNSTPVEPGQGGSRRMLGHLLNRLYGMELVGKEYVARYLRHKYRCHGKPLSLFGSFTAVSFFLKFLNKRGKKEVEQITREDLEAYIEHEQDRGLKISTVKTRMGQMYAFLAFLVEGGIVDTALVGRKIKLRLPKCLPRSMDSDDIDRLLCVRGDLRDRAMVLMLLRTGMRIGELLKIKVSDVDMKERKVLIYEGEKNSVGRVVYFYDDAKEALEAWMNQRNPRKVFLFYAQGRDSMCYTTARVIFERYLHKAGLSHKGYTLHCLRHTYATQLLNAGMRLEYLQKLMGHTNIEITRRYARLSDKSREEAYFRAMAIIERGEVDGHYGFDHQLQEIFEKEELLDSHREQLHEPS